MGAVPKTDFEQLFDALARHEVRYVVVGGVAVLLHGHPRFTADLDLAVALDSLNAERAIAALASLGYRPRAPIKAEDFADATVRQRWVDEKGLVVLSFWSPRFPATEVDLFATEPLPFDDLWRRATRIEASPGTTIPVASIEDLIALKERVSRPKDLQDIVELRRLLAERQ